MSEPSPNATASANGKSLLLLIVVAAQSAMILLLGVGSLQLYISIGWLRVHDQISIGMTVEDIRERFGEPDRISQEGEPLDPPHISGQRLRRTGYKYAYTYVWRISGFVVILFDEHDNVMTYYVGNV